MKDLLTEAMQQIEHAHAHLAHAKYLAGSLTHTPEGMRDHWDASEEACEHIEAIQRSLADTFETLRKIQEESFGPCEHLTREDWPPLQPTTEKGNR
jgi:RNA polymerase-binding transcription factor DksA